MFQEQERQLSALINNLPGAVFRVRNDSNYTVEYVSDQIAELTGYPADDFRENRRNFGDLMHPDDRDRVWNEIQKALAERRRYEVTYRFIDAHGKQKWNWERGMGIFDANGELQAVEGFVQDITERKRAEEELRRSENKWRTLVETTPDYIALYDAEGYFRFLNHYAEGYSEKDVVGKHYSALLPEASRLLYDQAFDKVRKTGKIESIEHEGPGHKGHMRTYNSYIVPIFEENRITNLMVIARDITERKRTEEQFRLSEERFSKAFHRSPAGMTITRIADGTFVDANESFCRMFEFSREEVIGHTSTELKMWTPEERKKLIEEQIKSGGLRNFELQARAKSGKIVNILFSSAPIELEGEPHHVTTIIDITDRKRTEETLRKTFHQLTTTEERLRRTAAQELHDRVGQNLTALSINLHHLLTQLSPEAKTKVEQRLRDSLSLLEDTIQRTRDIMTELRPSVLEEYGINAALQWYAQRFSERTDIPVQTHGKELSVRLPADVEYTMFRVIQECFTNIMKHSKATNVICTLEETATDVRCTIQDNGVGFAVDKIAQDKPEEHFGLLSMKERIAGIGGKFTIESKANKGTTVIIEIKK